MPSTQQQIIEQVKSTYSPLGKAFEKQTKAIADQGEKQIKAINNNKKRLTDTTDYYENKLLNSKQREMFINLYNKDLDKLEELNKKIDYNNLDYIVMSTVEETDFNKLKDPINFLDNVKAGKITIEEAKRNTKNLVNI